MILADPTDLVRTTGHAMEAWREAMRTAVRDPERLCRMLQLPKEIEAAAQRASRQFPLFAPHGYIARMRKGDSNDPLLRQVLPLADELDDRSGFTQDPVGDMPSDRGNGILQKYHGRVLIITTGACAVHCRYCFRRHFPFSDSPPSIARWEAVIREIQHDSSIKEVILSGGDPLTLVDSLLSQLAGLIAHVPHVRRLRVHTRLPIVIPQRVTGALVDWLNGSRLQPIVVVHANHPQELDAEVQSALAVLADAGVILLNQTVLLHGINDDAETLVQLSERLLDCQVMPYYLHQLDRVAGAAHFETTVDRGVALIKQMRARLPGYAIPRYARELAGESSKHVLA
jgi:EF-P beta-lysylation protein EpmB